MNAKKTNLKKLAEEALLARARDLGIDAWACRRRGWTKRLPGVLDDLRQVNRELGRRIQRDQARHSQI